MSNYVFAPKYEIHCSFPVCKLKLFVLSANDMVDHVLKITTECAQFQHNKLTRDVMSQVALVMPSAC